LVVDGVVDSAGSLGHPFKNKNGRGEECTDIKA
jgi:hypothetical protein